MVKVQHWCSVVVVSSVFLDLSFTEYVNKRVTFEPTYVYGQKPNSRSICYFSSSGTEDSHVLYHRLCLFFCQWVLYPWISPTQMSRTPNVFSRRRVESLLGPPDWFLPSYRTDLRLATHIKLITFHTSSPSSSLDPSVLLIC